MAMEKPLMQIGNSVGLILDKPLLDLAGIDRSGTVKITLEGSRIILEAAQPAVAKAPKKARIREATDRVVKQNDRLIKRLGKT